MHEMALASAFVLGLMSSGHCFGMCGGISAAFGMSVQANTPYAKWSRLFAYNSGRITCYIALGTLVGYLGSSLATQFHALVPVLRALAGFVLIAMACYVGQWWLGITLFERFGQRLWRYVQPLSQKLLPLDSIGSAYLFGLLWGFLPCGLVYSMLVWVATSGEQGNAAWLMLAFGLGTLPAMLAAGMAAQYLRQFLQSRMLRNVSGTLLLVFGVWTLASVFIHSNHS